MEGTCGAQVRFKQIPCACHSLSWDFFVMGFLCHGISLSWDLFGVGFLCYGIFFRVGFLSYVLFFGMGFLSRGILNGSIRCFLMEIG